MIELKPSYLHMAAGHWKDKVEWCMTNLYHGGHYEPNWNTSYPYIVFKDQNEYLLFCLRWGDEKE
jgi:hypothetical protein